MPTPTNPTPLDDAGGGAIVTEPGIYSLTSEQYHGHPTPTQCLGSTGARLLVNACPAEYRYRTDNPEVKTAFDIGNATHLLTLEPAAFEKRIGRVRFDDYRKKEAQAERDDIRASGRIPLLPEQVADVEAMRASVFDHPIAHLAFQGGAAEQSLFWRDPEFGFWCKCRPDYWPARRPYLTDLKTAVSAAPEDFSKAVINYGYGQQAAWYLDGVAAVTGEKPDRFAFIVVEKTAPYLVSICWLDPTVIEWGRILNRRARSVFAWCLEHDRWPGFQPDITKAPAAFTISLPAWAIRDLERRHEAGEFEPVA